MKLDFRVDGRTITHTLKNVLHAPNATNCLFSVSRFDEAGFRAEFGGGRVLLKRGQQTVGQGSKHGRLYLLDAHAQVPAVAHANVAEETRKLTWDEAHRAYGHLAHSGIRTLVSKAMVDGS